MDVQDSIPQLLTEILAEMKHANNAERSGAVSSVKVTLQRGTVDIAVHAYVGSDIQEAENQALASYRRILVGLNQDGVDAFEKTLETMSR
jgi:hypothetical protein